MHCGKIYNQPYLAPRNKFSQLKAFSFARQNSVELLLVQLLLRFSNRVIMEIPLLDAQWEH